MQTIQFEVDDATAQAYREATAEQKAALHARVTAELRRSRRSRGDAVRDMQAFLERVSDKAELLGLTEADADAIDRESRRS